MRKNIPSYRDLIGTIATKQGKVKVFLQRVPRIEDRVNIWKISNATVNKIPLLDEEYAYTPLGEWLSKNLPSASFLGVLLWQWVYFFYMFFVFFLIAKVLTWLVSKLLVVAYPKLSLETPNVYKKSTCLIIVCCLFTYTFT